MADREAAIAKLQEDLNDPTKAAMHDRIRAALAKAGRAPKGAPAPAQVAAPSPVPAAPPPSPAAGADEFTRPGEHPLDFGPRVMRGADRVGLPRLGNAIRWTNEVPAMAINKALDAMSFGAYRKGSDALADATGVRVGPSPEMYSKLEREHPITGAVGQFVGDVAPTGGPAKIGLQMDRAVGRALDPVLSFLARRGAGAIPEITARAAGSALAGSATAGAVAGGRKLVEKGGGLGAVPEAAEAALEAMPFGAAAGGTFGALAGTAGRVAKAIRDKSDNIQTLARAGLEPSPIPGRPVVRADESLTKQLPGRSEPPLVGRASPATRGRAGRESGEEIAKDITARKKASNQRFGELQAEAYAAEGENPASLSPIVADIERRLQDASLPDATRKALMDVRDRLDRFIPKPPPPAPPPPEPTEEMIQLQTMLAGSKPGAAREGLQRALAEAEARQPRPPAPPAPEEPPPFTAKELDRIRDYADSKVKSGEIKKGDVQFLQLSELMRKELGREGVGPGIAALNEKQSQIMKGRAKRQALLGMKRDQRGEGEDVYEAVARRVRERGEETGTAGARTAKEGHAIERLGRLGPPPSLPGTKGLPVDPGYQGLLDIPRLQLAQENLQLSPSKVFSGGGSNNIMSLPLRLLGERLIYPTARRAGDSRLGTKPVVVGDIADVVERRRDKKKQEKREAP